MNTHFPFSPKTDIENGLTSTELHM